MPYPSEVSLNFENIENQSIHLLGAKGTGMSALAEILVGRGARLSASDVAELFYTDEILAEIGVKVETFGEANLPDDCELLIRSAAYGDENPIVAAAQSRGIPVINYPEALGLLSQSCHATAIAGVHGKTTTTAITGALMKALDQPVSIIAGSAVPAFGNRSTWSGGDDFLIAETCEYRRHFLNFHPNRIVLTSVESDHQDYYPDYAAIKEAFLEFLTSLSPSGELIYCSDDEGARERALLAAKMRPDIRVIPYGESAEGAWQLEYSQQAAGSNSFRVKGIDRDFHLSIPGRHIALDAAAALALTSRFCPEPDLDILSQTLKSFKGSRRRSEIIAEFKGILVMDDYAHHPTAISATLKGLRAFYPERRLLVDFMPHTYSRTAALLDDFAQAFSDADLLILHPVYASAREEYDGDVSGKELMERAAFHRSGRITVYCEEFAEAVDYLKSVLEPGDLFISLGAGNNWMIGEQIIKGIAV